MYTYTGPSWAASSYPIEDENATNLAKLWNIPYVDQSIPGAHAIYNLNSLYKQKIPKGPVVWLYNEPLNVLNRATKMENKEFLIRNDWKEIWQECNQFCLNSIARLGRPVLLFGAHSDIVDCDHDNIVVGHKSWQRFLAEKAGMITRKGKINVTMDDGGSYSFRQCWGAEVIHRTMHENPDIEPNKSLTDSIWNMFFFWKQLEKQDLFSDVHPNLRGNKLFAEYTKPMVLKFLEDVK